MYFIGTRIYTFELADGDEVDDDTVHTSRVRRGGLTYPLLITKGNYYLFAEQVIIPRSAIPLGVDPYEVYYDHIWPDGSPVRRECCVHCDASSPARRKEFIRKHNVRYFKYDVIWAQHQRS